ncbi:uncharacterized protein LOC118323041 [Morone saxatilis]|uniref:uncharacterized protein LOC118323041 n=1 Tax=Morone saxatilis TaxID=34816 RepID=UPI0015E22CD6|nr:uncharacterized protein LOC118323041 [Morone saxatilis]
MPETIMDAIAAALPRLDEDRLRSLVERLLLVVGIEEVADLSYVKEDDIQDILTPIQSRKLIDAFQRRGLSNFIAKNVVAQYPKTFADVTDEGDLLGSGYTSLLNHIKTRVQHVNRNNTLSRIRRPKRTNKNDGDASQSQPKNTCSQVDSYGCINWQPHNLPEGETVDSLEVKRQMLVTLYRKEGPRGAERGMVDDLMHITYLKQQQLINFSPPFRVSDVMQEWPFLFQKRWLCSHFEKLTGIDIISRLTEALQNKGRRVINYFQHQKLKWRGEIQLLLTEMENDSRTLQDQDLMATSVVLLLMAYFREATDSLFMLADRAMLVFSILLKDTSTRAREEPGGSGKPSNLSDWGADGALLPLSHRAALQIRFLVRINPEDGKKCSARQGVSKKTGRVVHRKVMAINPHVNSFIRSLMEFEWRTSN